MYPELRISPSSKLIDYIKFIVSDRKLGEQFIKRHLTVVGAPLTYTYETTDEQITTHEHETNNTTLMEQMIEGINKLNGKFDMLCELLIDKKSKE